MKHIVLLFSIIFSIQINGQEKLVDAFVSNTKGEQVKILDQIDTLTIIDFWATWCKPCIAQMPALDEIKKKYKKKIKIISISIDTDIDKWKQFISSLKNQKHHYQINNSSPLIEYTKISMEEHGFYGASAQSIPVVMLLDKNGFIINKNCSHPASRRFRELIDQHL